MFEEGRMMPRAIECYEITQSWEQLLHSLSRSKDQFKEEEREALVNKYVPVALNSLYKSMSEDVHQGPDFDNNKGQMLEQKIKNKYLKKVDQIVEEDEYGDEFLSEEEENSEDQKSNEDKGEAKNGSDSEQGFLIEGEDAVSLEPPEDNQLLEQVFLMKKRKSENDDKKRANDHDVTEKKETAPGKKLEKSDDDNSFEI